MKKKRVPVTVSDVEVTCHYEDVVDVKFVVLKMGDDGLVVIRIDI